jgi:hypothetical protein
MGFQVLMQFIRLHLQFFKQFFCVHDFLLFGFLLAGRIRTGFV